MRLFAGVVVCLGLGTAWGDRPRPPLPVVELTPHPETRTLDVTVHGAGPSNRDDVVLSSDRGLFLAPRQVRTYREGNEPIAIVIVFNGQELYVDSRDDEDGEHVEGVLPALKRGLDDLGLAELAPPTSTIEIISYSMGAEVVVPREPLAAFKAAQLGTEANYRNRIGTDLVLGLALGLHELDESDAPIKLMFVIGDGTDTNQDAVRDELFQLSQSTHPHHISLGAAIYKSAISTEDSPLTELIPMADRVAAISEIVPALRKQIDWLTDRMYLTFDGALPWDGKPHDYTLDFHRVIGTAPVELTLPDLRERGSSSSWPYLQILGGLALLGLVALGLRIRAT
jgi:hypothetical protein